MDVDPRRLGVFLAVVRAAPKDVDLVAENGVLDDQLPPGPDRAHSDACDLARRSAPSQLRPQPLYATQDPRPDSSDARQKHPPLGSRTG